MGFGRKGTSGQRVAQDVVYQPFTFKKQEMNKKNNIREIKKILKKMWYH